MLCIMNPKDSFSFLLLERNLNISVKIIVSLYCIWIYMGTKYKSWIGFTGLLFGGDKEGKKTILKHKNFVFREVTLENKCGRQIQCDS